MTEPKTIRTSNCYTTWEQVAGYFDGDGALSVYIHKFTMFVIASWSDTFKPQLEGVAGFLRSQGLSPMQITSQKSRFGPTKPTVWQLALNEKGGLVKVLMKMTTLVVKKESQVRSAIEYLEDRTTGEEFLAVLNDAVKSDARSSSIRRVKTPWTRSRGIFLARSSAGHESFGTPKMHLDKNMVRDAKTDYEKLGVTIKELADLYNVKSTSLYRAMRKLH